MELADGRRIEVPIIQDVGLKFSLDGILDAPIDAIRAFYTSPVDALLLGNLLIKKSDSPTRRA
jgi:predicted NodU family carbamoyl transferase